MLLPALVLLSTCSPLSAELNLLGGGECRCTLIDVGLNDGTSLDYWLLPAAQRNYDVAFKQRHPKQHDAWEKCLAGPPDTICYYGFEGNARFTPTLQALQAKWRAAGRRIMLYTENLFAKHGGSAKVRYHFDA